MFSRYLLCSIVIVLFVTGCHSFYQKQCEKIAWETTAAIDYSKQTDDCLRTSLFFNSDSNSSDNVEVFMKVNNICDEARTFLTWYTPFSGFGRSFEVLNSNGKRLKSTNLVLARMPEPKLINGGIIEIGPGGTRYSGMNLSNWFHFEEGNYRVRFKYENGTGMIPQSEFIEISVN